MPDGTTAQEDAGTTSIFVPLLLLSLIAATTTMDPAIANIALVKATRSLHIASGLISLAATISTLTASATVISSGFLADRYGRRKLLLAGLVVTIAGGVIVACAFSTFTYLLGRAVAGVGLGAAFSIAFSFVRIVAGEERFGRALGQWTAQLAVLAIVGQVAAGIIIHSVGWRAGMLLVPLVALVCLVATPAILLSVRPSESKRADIPGQILLVLGIAGTIYGVANMSRSLSGAGTWVPLFLGGVLLGLFAIVELRSDHAVFPIRLFARWAFLAAVVTGLIWDFVNATVTLQLSNFWQYVLRFDAQVVATGLLPFALSSMAVALVVGRLLNRRASLSGLFLVGTAAIAAGFVLFAIVTKRSHYAAFLPAMVLIGAGVPLLSVTSASLFVAEAPAESYGVVTSSRLAVGQFGFSLGTAVSTLLVFGLTRVRLHNALLAWGVPQFEVGGAVTSVSNYVLLGGQKPAMSAGRVALAHAASSYVHSFIFLAVFDAVFVLTLGLVSVWLVRGLRGTSGELGLRPRHNAIQ